MNNGDFLFFWACSDTHKVLTRFECSFLERETIANVLVSRESDQRVPFLHFSKSSFASAKWARGRFHILLWSMDVFSLRRISRAFICKLRLFFFCRTKNFRMRENYLEGIKVAWLSATVQNFRVNYPEFFSTRKKTIDQKCWWDAKKSAESSLPVDLNVAGGQRIQTFSHQMKWQLILPPQSGNRSRSSFRKGITIIVSRSKLKWNREQHPWSKYVLVSSSMLQNI